MSSDPSEQLRALIELAEMQQTIYKEKGVWTPNADVVKRLATALLSVLELHEPDDPSAFGIMCSHCNKHHQYPCDTVQVLTAALNTEGAETDE